jgi:hypothetical protein
VVPWLDFLLAPTEQEKGCILEQRKNQEPQILSTWPLGINKVSNSSIILL